MIIPQKFYTLIPKGEWNRNFYIKLIDNQSTKAQKRSLKYEVVNLNQIKRDEKIELEEVVLENITGFTITLTDSITWNGMVNVIISSDELLERTGGGYNCILSVFWKDVIKAIFDSGNVNSGTISGKCLLTKSNMSGKYQTGITLNNLNDSVVESMKVSEALAKDKILWKNWIPGHKYQITYNRKVIYLGTLPFYYSRPGSCTKISIDRWDSKYRTYSRNDEKIPVFINSDSYYVGNTDSFSGNIVFVKDKLENHPSSFDWLFESSKSIKGSDLGEVFPNEGEDLDYVFSSYCVEKVKEGDIDKILRINTACVDDEIKDIYLKKIKSIVKNILTKDRSTYYYGGGTKPVYVTLKTPGDQIYTALTSRKEYDYDDDMGLFISYVNGSFLGTKPSKEEVIALIEEAKK